jgi:Domain of Unknown Function with PDB structure (DUF3857)
VQSGELDDVRVQRGIRFDYLVYKVLTQKGADGWDSISLEWEPWHEERPTMRARVVHAFDPNTITDSPAHDDNDKT